MEDRWCNSSFVVRPSHLQPDRRGFASRSRHGCVTTRDNLFTHMCLTVYFYQAVHFGSDGVGRLVNPELDVRLWRTCDERTRTQRYKYHTLLFTLYIHHDLHRSLSWWQVSPGAASITRRIRGHAHPVPIRHWFPQLPAANHRAVASRLQPRPPICLFTITLCGSDDDQPRSFISDNFHGWAILAQLTFWI